MSAGLIFFVFIIGGAVYLLMEYTLIFWLVAVPIVLLLMLSFVGWLKK